MNIKNCCCDEHPVDRSSRYAQEPVLVRIEPVPVAITNSWGRNLKVFIPSWNTIFWIVVIVLGLIIISEYMEIQKNEKVLRQFVKY